MSRAGGRGGVELAAAVRAVEAWRAARTTRRVPEEVWQRAAAVARRHGASAVAKALRLDYYEIRRRVRRAAEERGSPAFVEIVAAREPNANVMELEDGRGVRMRLPLSGDTAVLERWIRFFLERPA